MIAAIKQIEQRPIVRPNYARADNFDTWLRLNHMLCWDYWCRCERAADADPERPGAFIDFHDFALTQYDLTSSPTPGLTGTALKSNRAEPEGSEGFNNAGCGPVAAGGFLRGE